MLEGVKIGYQFTFCQFCSTEGPRYDSQAEQELKITLKFVTPSSQICSN